MTAASTERPSSISFAYREPSQCRAALLQFCRRRPAMPSSRHRLPSLRPAQRSLSTRAKPSYVYGASPRLSRPASRNVITHLPDGHPVRAVTGRKKDGFLEVEANLFGANVRGFASAEFLTPASPRVAEAARAAAEAAPTGIVAVTMPRRPGTVTKRTQPADAHSLNEPNQPARKGTTPVELVGELGTIINWLAVEKSTHKHYLPHDGLTFCNIYTHDYCHLAGAYLPRVWWTQRAIIDLTHGRTVEPLLGNTIVEMRANDLFRWLRDFGGMFGWRQTGTLTKLQQNANQGGLHPHHCQAQRRWTLRSHGDGSAGNPLNRERAVTRPET